VVFYYCFDTGGGPAPKRQEGVAFERGQAIVVVERHGPCRRALDIVPQLTFEENVEQ